jgi:hypothetical protein
MSDGGRRRDVAPGCATFKAVHRLVSPLAFAGNFTGNFIGNFTGNFTGNLRIERRKRSASRSTAAVIGIGIDVSHHVMVKYARWRNTVQFERVTQLSIEAPAKRLFAFDKPDYLAAGHIHVFGVWRDDDGARCGRRRDGLSPSFDPTHFRPARGAAAQ